MLLSGNLKGVQHIGIPTANVDLTKSWYNQIFGFQTVYNKEFSNKAENVKVVFLKLGDLVIETYQTDSGENHCTQTVSHGHIDHFAINTTDIDLTLQDALSKGAVLDSSTKEGPVFLENFWTQGVKYVNFTGPNGEKIEVNQRLDMQQKVHGQRATGWAYLGIPVKDLENTKSFYHNFGFIERMSAGIKTETGLVKAVILEKNGFEIELYQPVGQELKELALRNDGFIDHIALDVSDIEAAYREIRQAGIEIIEKDITFLPFWENGVRFFTIRGPNMEKIEFNQILSK